jgi:murein DD-endopeptidase MepM/ murein hydrolase activator NlpD
MVSRLIIAIGGLCSLIAPAFLQATVLPKQARVPGGIAIIELATGKQPPEVRYLGHRTLVMRDPNKPNTWITVVGIPLSTQPGVQSVEVITANQQFSKTFTVKSKKYPTEKLKIKDQRKVTPSPEDYEIISAQYLETINTYAKWHAANLDSLTLTLPVKGRKSSPFGLTRIMNNIAKDPHSGLDIAAATGTKITCPRHGRVLNIGNFFYSGNMVFIDHGQGFITSYCHLDSITVEKGQILKAGDVIGTVGKTGRVTGPHLHWSVSLNGARVDPLLFINE